MPATACWWAAGRIGPGLGRRSLTAAYRLAQDGLLHQRVTLESLVQGVTAADVAVKIHVTLVMRPSAHRERAGYQENWQQQDCARPTTSAFPGLRSHHVRNRSCLQAAADV